MDALFDALYEGEFDCKMDWVALFDNRAYVGVADADPLPDIDADLLAPFVVVKNGVAEGDGDCEPVNDCTLKDPGAQKQSTDLLPIPGPFSGRGLGMHREFA